MQPERLNAIVLGTSNYGESDRVASLFTLEQGRLNGFARGVRASRKRFGGLLEPTNRLELILTLKEEGLSRIERIEQIACYPELREHLESLALALYACELVGALTPEGHPLPRLYRLLASLLEHLSRQTGTVADRRFFEINTLNILGYRPVLNRDALKPLENCLRTGAFGKICFTDTELEAAAGLLNRAIAGHCPRPLKSRAFLEDVGVS